MFRYTPCTTSSRAEFTLEPVDIGLAFSVQLAPFGRTGGQGISSGCSPF